MTFANTRKFSSDPRKTSDNFGSFYLAHFERITVSLEVFACVDQRRVISKIINAILINTLSMSRWPPLKCDL